MGTRSTAGDKHSTVRRGTRGRAHEDKDYVLDALDGLLRPKLRLVGRNGKSDGVPRGKGKLRLVTWDQEEDDELDSDDLDRHEDDLE